MFLMLSIKCKDLLCFTVGSTGIMQAYQIAIAGSLPQGVVMATTRSAAISTTQIRGGQKTRIKITLKQVRLTLFL